MRSVVNRILTDRFWQAGISEGSKDDFYARVIGTKSTMEGFASSIRGSVRTVRDSCYSIIYCLSRLDVHFYGFEELPGPLAHALFADAHCLSSHQLINLLNLVRYLVDDCPVQLRDHFVPPILAACFAQIDSKISSEWDKLGLKLHSTSEDDDLTEEMKEESSLRQLTHSAVLMVAGVLDPNPARSGKLVVSVAIMFFLRQAYTTQIQSSQRQTNQCVASAYHLLPSLNLLSSSALMLFVCGTHDAAEWFYASSAR